MFSWIFGRVREKVGPWVWARSVGRSGVNAQQRVDWVRGEACTVSQAQTLEEKVNHAAGTR